MQSSMQGMNGPLGSLRSALEDSNIKTACGNKLYIHDPYVIWQLPFLLPATCVSSQLSRLC
jgi:hypothetical protein